MNTEPEIDDLSVRRWFMTVDLAQAKETFHIVEGIIQTREEFQPKRKPRSDVGKKRAGLAATGPDQKLFETEGGN